MSGITDFLIGMWVGKRMDQSTFDTMKKKGWINQTQINDIKSKKQKKDANDK